MSNPKIVLFDGVCNFCNSSVQFIIKHDKTNALQFASLQSPIGEQLRKEYNISPTEDSVIFIEDGKAYTKSQAAFRIGKYFGGAWKLLQIFAIIPASISNIFYDIIARNRYKWFGKRDACMIPNEAQRARFLG